MSLRAVVYTADGVTRCDHLEDAIEADGEPWIHATAAESTELRELCDAFGIHPLAVQDVREGTARPKTQEYDTHTFVFMKTARLSQRDVAFEKEIRAQPVGFFIGSDWLVTLSPAESGVIADAESRWDHRAGYVSERGTDFVAYRIMDAIVDGYFDLLDEIETDIEAVEERVLTETDPQLLEALNDVRRDLLAFRKIAWPTREAVAYLSRGGSPEVAERNEKYFRDVYDHLVQVVDLIETYRDLTSGSRDIYLNAVAQSTNEVMRTLTVVATIFIPLTFVAGVYGMNFAGSPLAMPELYWTYGYPAVMIGMAAAGGLMLLHFRRQGWL